MSKIIVIGGGASGMMAAGVAAGSGHSVLLIEKNKILGKKLLITGKGRCNITNACGDVRTLLSNVPTNSSFLYSSFYTFTNLQTIEFFEGLGVKTKVERGERVFPVSDDSSEIVSALASWVKRSGAEVMTGVVTKVLVDDGRVTGVELSDGRILDADKVVIATGGCSYRRTGSTGDGYRLARELGHGIVPPKPSLVPLEIEEDWVKELQGLSLKNVEVKVVACGRTVYTDFGEMIFTHFGVSGPIVLSCSAHMRDVDGAKLYLDLKPALTHEQLDKRVIRDFEEYINRDFINSLGKLLPAKLVPVIAGLSGIPPEVKVNSVTKEQRKRLVDLLKRVSVTVKGFRPIEEAIITSGGVSVGEINPSTLESKLVKGLHFTGEVIDVDAYTGGFNLQIAWSTGYLAGSSL